MDEVSFVKWKLILMTTRFRYGLVLLLSTLWLSYLLIPASACTTTNVITGQTTWVNCTIVQNTTNPIQALFKTDTTNAPWIGNFVFLAIVISALFFFMVGAQNFLHALTFTAFFSIILAITLTYFSFTTATTVDFSIGFFGIMLILLYLFR